MSASSDEIPLSLSLPRPLQALPVCEALQYTLWLFNIAMEAMAHL